jgi:hypothetical protein
MSTLFGAPPLALDGRSLVYLAEKGHLEQLKARLAALPSQEQRDAAITASVAPFDDTPLHASFHMSQVEVVRFLLDHTVADSSKKDARGLLPIERATRKGHLDLVLEMLDRGERATGGAGLGRLMRLAISARKWRLAHEICKRMSETDLFRFLDAPIPVLDVETDTAFAVPVDARGDDARDAEAAHDIGDAIDRGAEFEPEAAQERANDRRAEIALSRMYSDERVEAMKERGFPANVLPFLRDEHPSVIYAWLHHCLARPLERAIAHSERDPAALDFVRWLLEKNIVSFSCLAIEAFPHPITAVEVPADLPDEERTVDQMWSATLQKAVKLASKGFGIALSTNPKALALLLRTPAPFTLPEGVAGLGSVPEKVLQYVKLRTTSNVKTCKAVVKDCAWERRKHFAIAKVRAKQEALRRIEERRKREQEEDEELGPE